MQIFTQTIPIPFKADLPKKYSSEDILFFDIETTGLTPVSSYVFLIGCGYFKENNLIVTQWLMEDPADEPLLLKSFLALTASFKRLVHYNGSAFDLPFLKKRCQVYNIHETFSQTEASDVYKKLCKHKKLFNVSNYKLKTVEKLADFRRTDRLEGIQLTDIFIKYTGRRQFERIYTKNTGLQHKEDAVTIPSTFAWSSKTGLISVPSETSEALSKLLLLHNLEDITGLVKVCSLLNIEKFVDGDFMLDAFVYDDYSLYLRLKPSYSLPACINASFGFWGLQFQDNFVYIEIPFYHAELEAVCPDAPKLKGRFLRIPDGFAAFAYKADFKTACTFLNADSEFLANEMLLYDYVCRLLKTV